MEINKDNVFLVDEQNNQIGEMDKFEAHQHPAKLHRCSSVWLMNDKNQVLLQKRSLKKIVGAGWWANAICGNVRPPESFNDCAIRRLREEIGVIGVKISPIYQFIYRAYCNEKYGEHEFDQVYFGNYNGNLILNEDEASDYCWINLNDLLNQVNANSKVIAPEQTIKMSTQQLKKSTPACEIMIKNQNELLAPWTCIMLNDPRLIETLNN